MNQGSSNKLIYDNCAYAQWVYSSTQPLNYQLYMGKNENCGKCVYDKQFWYKGQKELVDIESELRNQTRPASRCGIFKYNPKCPKSDMCTSTYNKKTPVVIPGECCPIVYNNIRKVKDIGYVVPDPKICGISEDAIFAPAK